MRPVERDTSKLPKWARDRLDYAERVSNVNTEYWEKMVAEATRGKGPYTFIMNEDERQRMPREIRVRMINDEIEVMSSYGGALYIKPQVPTSSRLAWRSDDTA